MDANTLRQITTGMFERPVDAALEEHLAAYVPEIAAALATVRTAARELPADLPPAPVFSLKND
jgi:hypothetical protein